MAYAPYTSAELAELRKIASEAQPSPVVHKLLATLTFVEAERDALWAQAEGLGEFSAQVMAERDKAKADLERLREAARALVESLASDHGRRPWGCRECGALATRTGADLGYCDGCDPGGFTSDHTHAPALRTLRAILEAP